MRRIPIQLDEKTYLALKERAFRERRSIAELVRESVAAHQKVDRRSIEQFSFVGSGSSPADRRQRISEDHDRALARAFSPRGKSRK